MGSASCSLELALRAQIWQSIKFARTPPAVLDRIAKPRGHNGGALSISSAAKQTRSSKACRGSGQELVVVHWPRPAHSERSACQV